jgi:hypothetical protein
MLEQGDGKQPGHSTVSVEEIPYPTDAVDLLHVWGNKMEVVESLPLRGMST